MFIFLTALVEAQYLVQVEEGSNARPVERQVMVDVAMVRVGRTK